MQRFAYALALIASALFIPAPAHAAITFTVSADLDGRGSLSVADRVAPNRYRIDQQISIICQQPGPSYGGSAIWDFTADNFWVPDAFVRTGYSGYHPGLPRCFETGVSTDIIRAAATIGGPYLVKVLLDGRSRPIVNDPNRQSNVYAANDRVYIKCQDNGESYGGSTIWDYTTDMQWIPDAYVTTGYSGFIPSVPRCSAIGLLNPGTTTHGPFYAKFPIDGRDSLSAQANRITDSYASGEAVNILCQERGPFHAGSDVWDFTSKNVWVPDVYVYTGTVNFVPGIPKCSESPVTGGVIGGIFRGDFGPYLAKVDINGRRSPRVNDWDSTTENAYLQFGKVHIRCQGTGETVGGSNIWNYTREKLWVPDVYVRTGTSSFLAHVPRCYDISIPGVEAILGTHGPFVVKETLDARSGINPEVIAQTNRYVKDSRVYIKCQDLGVTKYGSSIWNYLSDNYWVPDAMIKTGTDGFVAGIPTCGSIGVGGGGAPSVPNNDASGVRASIVNSARGQLGTAEWWSGGVENCNPYGFCDQWCTMFATWTWAQNGVHVAAARTRGDATWFHSNNLYQWALRNGRVRGFSEARPGDIVIYGDSPSRTYHTGVVEYVYPDGDISTIEGNLNNSVSRQNKFRQGTHPRYQIFALVAPVRDELTAPVTRPTNLRATPDGNARVKLEWSPSPDASSYFVEMRPLGTAIPWTRLNLTVHGTSHVVEPVTGARWYSFRIFGANGTKTGPPSDPDEVRTLGHANYQTYYALGDSYSSGLGAGGGEYTGGECKRTTAAWPFEMPGYIPDPIHRACASDTMSGLREQLKLIPASVPYNTLITLTVGGNDIGFGPALKKCWTDDCTGLEKDLIIKIDQLVGPLTTFLLELRQQAPGADVVIAGYPLLVPSSSEPRACALLTRLSGAEMNMIYSLGIRLNEVIIAAAWRAGIANSVDETVAEFRGHSGCAPGTENQYINQIVGANFEGESWHPKGIGQQAYARAVGSRLWRLGIEGFLR